MKHLLFIGVALFYSVSVIAAVTPTKQRARTPVTTVDLTDVKVEVTVPNTISDEEEKELSKQDLGNIRKYKGMEDAKYARNFVKKLRDDPEGVMWHTYHVSPSDIPQRDLSDKTALGSDKAPMGIVMKETLPEGTHWVDSLNDVRLPDFVGDYHDMRQMQSEFAEEHAEAEKQLRELKLPREMKAPAAPIMPQIQ